ncbi:MAG: polysaccharide pyruvyl transferase family protein [Candidatus Gracilibacteria bacterium]|nr:polysaccharide pyruvyl transferase family protein [Candidatus Gracilibacteria bacterium]
MNITIFMATGCQNLGDELILKNEIKLLENENIGKKINFNVFSYDLKDDFLNLENIKYIEYFPIGIKNLKNIFINLKNLYLMIKAIFLSDEVVFGGGGIIFDNEKGNYSNPLKQILFRKKIAEFFNKKIRFFAISVDIKNEKNYKIVKNIFSNTKITVRDDLSKDFLTKLGIESQKNLDPVFYDNGDFIENNNLLLKSIEPNEFGVGIFSTINISGKTIGLALRRGYFGEKEIYKINEVIKYLLKNNSKIILLPHSFHQIDEVANDYLYLKQFLKPGVEISSSIYETYDFYNQKKIDLCLSMRLHSMILSKVYGIEFIAIKYSKKTHMI